ncbi:MAG: hypothetical protein LC772_03060 [Chloroflexi bacterium]|nr:hypothetical protein [Chloroflexota bacterium]
MNDVRHRFERLAAGLQKPVYNAALRLTGSAEDGLDLARETFVRAYSLYLSGARPGHFRPLVYHVLMEVYTEHLSRSSPPPRWMEGLLDHEDVSGGILPGDSAVPSFLRGDEGSVEEALSLLPRDLSIVVLLCDVEGFSYGQVGQMVRRPRVWVAGNLYMGRRMLRAVLRKQPGRQPPIGR